MPLSDVKDPAFSSGALGSGFAIMPTDHNVYAPVSGTISVVFPTKHAYGITTKNNEEILIHIGIDTVKLNGQYFTSHVKQGDIVIAGDLLATVDFDKVKEAGYDPSVIVVDTSNKKSIKLLNKEDKITQNSIIAEIGAM